MNLQDILKAAVTRHVINTSKKANNSTRRNILDTPKLYKNKLTSKPICTVSLKELVAISLSNLNHCKADDRRPILSDNFFLVNMADAFRYIQA